MKEYNAARRDECPECGKPKHMDSPICRKCSNEARGNWIPGERRIASTGYVRIKVPGGREVLEHRHIMEQHLGRKLERYENVHHLNGDRTDNRLDNLELWDTSQPAGQRPEDKIAWAKEILARYGEI